MKRDEADELRRAEVRELVFIRRNLGALERSTRRPAATPLNRRPRRHLDGLPGWEQPVPDSHVREGARHPVVTCRCGSETELVLRLPMACAGACGRWFMRTSADVKYKRFEEAE